MAVFGAQDFDKVINQSLYQAKLLIQLLGSDVSKAQEKALFSAIAQTSHMVYLALLYRYADDFALPQDASFDSALELQAVLKEQGRIASELDELVVFEQSKADAHWLAHLVSEYRASSQPKHFLQRLAQEQAAKAQRAQTIAIALDEAAESSVTSQTPLESAQAWYQGLSELVQRYRQNAQYY